MTYDPDRDARAPGDVNPNERPYGRQGAGVSVALMLGLMAAFIAVGFWLSATPDRAPIAAEDRAAMTTTGSASQERPLPKTPTPPTVPSPPRQ